MLSRPRWLMPLLLSPLGLLIPIAPRGGPPLVLLIGLAGIIHYIRHRPSLDWLKSKSVAALAAFLVYLMASGLWSQVPERSFEQAFRLMMLAFFGLAGFSLIRSLDDAQKQRLTTCLLPALVLGIVTGCIYGLLHHAGPSIRVVTDFIGASPEFSNFHSPDNRLHIAKTMLLTILAFFALLLWLWQKQKTMAIAAYIGLLTVCFHSDSQSSLVAALAGGAVFGALRLSNVWGPRLVMLAIVASFVLVVPFSQSTILEQVKTEAKNTALGKKTSPDVRVRIYRLFSVLSLERPILGHGLMAGVKFESADKGDYNGVWRAIRTPHNIHLQAIFDLGFIGTGLLLLALLLPIWHLHKNGRHAAASCLLLPLSIMLAGTSFNFVIWRVWIPGATILLVWFLYLNSVKSQLSCNHALMASNDEL